MGLFMIARSRSLKSRCFRSPYSRPNASTHLIADVVPGTGRRAGKYELLRSRVSSSRLL